MASPTGVDFCNVQRRTAHSRRGATVPCHGGYPFVTDPNVVAFTWDVGRNNGIRADSAPLTSLNPPSPGPAIDPRELSCLPDGAVVALGSGMIHDATTLARFGTSLLRNRWPGFFPIQCPLSGHPRLTNSIADAAWAMGNVAITGEVPSPPESVPFAIAIASSSTTISVCWIAATGAMDYSVERKLGAQPWEGGGHRSKPGDLLDRRRTDRFRLGAGSLRGQRAALLRSGSVLPGHRDSAVASAVENP